MIPPLENHFGKITAWSLIYFLNYAQFDILAQSQILGLTLYLLQIEWKPILNFFGILFGIISGDFKGGLSAAFTWIPFATRESEWKPKLILNFVGILFGIISCDFYRSSVCCIHLDPFCDKGELVETNIILNFVGILFGIISCDSYRSSVCYIHLDPF